MRKRFSIVCALAMVSVMWGQKSAMAADLLYTLGNNPIGNTVESFSYNNKKLTSTGSYSTGGLGTGGSLSNQGGLVLTDDKRFLLAVNAGSNDVSVFRFNGKKLAFVGKAPSGGERPVSITTRKSLVYVLNGGGVNNVTGFRLSSKGSLSAIPGASATLSADATGPAQVSFSDDADTLIVTERATNNITTISLDASTGLPLSKHVVRAPGDTPFGFDFDPAGNAYVSEAFGGAASALSSYSVFGDGTLGVISPSVAAGSEAAACWVKVHRSGKYAFVSNTGTGSVSLFRLSEGRVDLVSAIAGVTGNSPTDLQTNPEGSRLFVLSRGSGFISVFRFRRNDESLTPELQSDVVLTPGSATGMVVR